MNLIAACDIQGQLGFAGVITDLRIFSEAYDQDYYPTSGLVHYTREPQFRIIGVAPGNYILRGAAACCAPKYQDWGKQIQKSVRVAGPGLQEIMIEESDLKPFP